jgi:hypothetical protein
MRTGAWVGAVAVVGAATGGAVWSWSDAEPPQGEVVTVEGGGSGAGAGVAAAAPLYAWVQLGSTRGPLARAVVSAPAACPSLLVDGATLAMSSRAKSPPAFSAITVCEAVLPSSTKSVQLQSGLVLPAPSGAAQDVVVLGDTGCRNSNQPCTGDPNKPTSAGRPWGFPVLAASAAKVKADLFIHVGDYLYREHGCSECGLGWTTWEAEWFKPAQAGGLLTRAPWVFARGNHEGCTRAWEGYALLLAPDATPATLCQSGALSLPPAVVPLHGLDVHVVDSSFSATASSHKPDVEQAQADFTTVKSTIGTSTTDAWLVTHWPICGDVACQGALGTAWDNSGLGQVAALKWLHVGHVHLFRHIQAGQAGHGVQHPAQTITGGSGTSLDPCPGGGACDDTSYTFLHVSRSGAGWSGTVLDTNGATVSSMGTISVP